MYYVKIVILISIFINILQSQSLPSTGVNRQLFQSGDIVFVYQDNQWHFTCESTDSYNIENNAKAICKELGFYSYDTISSVTCNYQDFPSVSNNKKYQVIGCYNSQYEECSISLCPKQSTNCQTIICQDTPFFFTSQGIMLIAGIVVVVSILYCCCYNYRHNNEIKQRVVIMRQRRDQIMKKQQEELEQQRQQLLQNQQIQPFPNMMQMQQQQMGMQQQQL